MVIKIFAVWDAKASFYGTPFCDQNENSAIRNFSDAVRDGSNPNNLWNKHPEDFSLYCIGEFDNTCGEIIPQTPRALITASALQELYNEKQIGDELRVLKNPKGFESA